MGIKMHTFKKIETKAEITLEKWEFETAKTTEYIIWINVEGLGIFSATFNNYSEAKRELEQGLPFFNLTK